METGMPLRKLTVVWVGLKIMISYSRYAFSPNKVFVNRVIKKQSGTRKGSVNTKKSVDIVKDFVFAKYPYTINRMHKATLCTKYCL